MAIASTPCSPLPATTSALGYNEDRRHLQLMDGWQARHGGPTCVQNIPERGWGPWQENGEGPLRSRRCQNGTTRNTLSSGMLTARFLFPKFFPKKFGQKPTGNFGNGLCAGPVLLHPAPSFVQMKNTPGGPSRGAGFQARYSARAIDHWVGQRRLVTSFMPVPATFLPHLTVRVPVSTRSQGVEASGAFGGSAEWASGSDPASSRCESDAPMWAHVWVDADERPISL